MRSWRKRGPKRTRMPQMKKMKKRALRLLLLVLLLAGGATTVTVGFVTVFESNVTAVCAKALPFSVAPVFKTIAV